MSTTNLQTHQQRVVAEKASLDSLLSKLREFIEASPLFPKLPDDEQLRLQRQAIAMSKYSDVLGERIAAF